MISKLTQVLSFSSLALLVGTLINIRNKQHRNKSNKSTNPSELSKKLDEWACGSIFTSVLAVGHKLRLFDQLFECTKPVTAKEFALKTKLSERWLEEWLLTMSSAGIVQYHVFEATDDKDCAFSLDAAGAKILCSYETYGEDSMIGWPYLCASVSPRVWDVAECFKTGGGFSYDFKDSENHDIARSIQDLHAKMADTLLVSKVMPEFDRRSKLDIMDKLKSGIKVADVGCGAGGALMAMAKAFPNSEFHGFEISDHALKILRKLEKESGLANLVIHDARDEPLGKGKFAKLFDIVFCYDLIHDCAHPKDILKHMKAGVKPNGVVTAVDITTQKTMSDKIENGVPPRFAISCMLCMPSGLSEKGGMGLGTCGLHNELAEQLFNEVGFKHVQAFDHPELPGNLLILAEQ